MTLNDPHLEQEVTAALRSLSQSAWIAVLKTLLERMGYQDVKLVGRSARQGLRYPGGCDLTAVRLVPDGQRRILVQAKQYPPSQPVLQRMVDEVRGVCLRQSAAEGILITTGPIAGNLDRKRLASKPLIPVRLIDGPSLVALLAAHRLGVWETGPETALEPARRGLDAHYFAELEELSALKPGKGRGLTVSITVSAKGRATRRTVTL